MKNTNKLTHCHAPSFIRHVLEHFRLRSLNAVQATSQLGISRSRLYALATAWPQPVLDLLKKRLTCAPPCPYSFTASEALRLHALKLDRARVRRWALENNLAHAVPAGKVRAPVRRWQRTNWRTLAAHSVRATEPHPKQKPSFLFTNRTKPPVQV